MKKNWFLKDHSYLFSCVRKIVKIMRLSIFLIVLTSLQALATSNYAQGRKINVKVENKTVAEVLQLIEHESDYFLFYNNKVVDLAEIVTLDLTNKSVIEVLDVLFEGKGVSYTVTNKQIVLSKKAGKSSRTDSVQQKSVSGKVTDEEGEPLPGVTVLVKGTTQGTVTDIDGNYSIPDIPEDATLVFSFVGMRTQEIPVDGKNKIDITLEEDAIGLEEIVAVGYGIQKKVNLSGSVATLSAEELSITPIASTTNALAGQLPGLISKQESGLPGGDRASLSIRGFGSPLVIVDGIESDFNNIDANEIESISILKDASAAIYGARAGNGVILVTTKRGTINKPIIKFNSSMTFQGATFLPKLASSGQNAELKREAHLNSGQPESTARFTQEEVDLFYAGTNPDYPNTDWLKIVARDWAPQQNHNISVRGGSDNIKYYGYLGFLDQQSMFKNNGGEYQRYNVRSNIDAKITDELSIQFDLSSIIENRDFPWRPQDSDVWQEYWDTEPFYAPTLPDPTKIAYGGNGGAVGIHATTNSEIVGYQRTNSQDLKGTLALKYDFSKIKGLSAKAYANYNQSYSFLKKWDWLVDSWTYNYANDTYTQRTVGSNRGLTYSDSKNRILTGQFSLNFDRTFYEDHHVTAMAVYEVIDYKSNYVAAFRDGQKTFGIDYFFAGSLANQKANDGASEMGRQSYIGKINYAFKSKYLLESTLRIDKSAKFSEEERTGIFPSLSLAWRLSEENFLKDNIPSLENLKLRASVSQTGNDAIGNFQYLSGYKYGDSYIIASNASIGLTATGLANPFLTWETMTIYNSGIDFSLSKRKLYGELDFFYRDRTGIPGQRTVSLPSTFGADLPTENLNSINTRGFELRLGNVGKLQDLRWDISANISWSRSKWGFFDEPGYDDPDQERLHKRTGKWTDIIYGYASDGLFTSQEEIENLDFVYNEEQGNTSLKPGDIRYKDINQDGLLDWRDQVEIGKGTMPHWMGGINLNMNYKNVDLVALFQGALGFYQNVVLYYGANYSELMYKERWTPENNKRDGLIPRVGGAISNSWNSDFNNLKSDYLRLKSMSLGYNLNNSFINKLHLQNVRLYVAGTNIFTLSNLNKYTVDPEGQSGKSGHYYPQMRSFTFGVNISL